MAKKLDGRMFSVAVVGLSGTEKQKGATGIGKSCLCNRFMRPLADDYYTDHISVLSQSDFGGRVVNNDHFLYWGENTVTSDEGHDFTFSVIEQTEFIDDSSFQPFKSGKTEPYIKRCCNTKLQSAEKLMYICKNQLGLEHEFEEKMLVDGKMNVDGFLCLYDVSTVHQRSLESQTEFTAVLLANLLKTKKPVVLATTKCDDASETHIREAEKLVNRKEFKGSIPLVETSAHENVNVELAFLTLAHLIDRTKGRLKVVSYSEAARARKEVLDVATEAYQRLINSQVTDYKALWIPIHRRLVTDDNYQHYVNLFGTEQAKRLFRRRVIALKEEFIQAKQKVYLERLRGVVAEILPDLGTIADRSWPSTLRWLQRQDWFEQYFVVVPDGLPWQESDLLEHPEEQIPFDLLDSPEAEGIFREHVTTLRTEYKRQQLQRQFKQLLEDNHNVGPGKTLEEVSIFFLGRECYSALAEDDKQKVYEQHQRELKEKARRDFLELLLENADLFSRFDPHSQVTNEDLRDITMRIQNEQRFRALARLEEDRKVILLNHLGFIQCPSRDRCPFREHCVETLIERLLATKAHRPQSWSHNSQFALDSEDNRLNLVILGSEGLADQLVNEIRRLCVNDLYSMDKDTYSLDYRPIDGDVSMPHNSFRTSDFMPHGCFCVYNSLDTLGYIHESLEKTLMSDLQREDRMPFQGLPIVIVLAHEPTLTEKGLMALRDEGQHLSDRLQCAFVDIPSSLMTDDLRRFHEDQVQLAMHRMVGSVTHRSTFISPWPIAESIEPDMRTLGDGRLPARVHLGVTMHELMHTVRHRAAYVNRRDLVYTSQPRIRILMCFMCGDPFSVELPLSPLLNHQCCYVTSDKFPTITLETYLDDSKRKVEVTLVSYHGALLMRDELYHGYILVYSAKRRASLANLRAFANQLSSVPTKILAVTESGGANAFFSSEHAQNLLTDGNAIADHFGASFMTTCPNFQSQTASYTPFFKEAWERKSETESAFTFATDEYYYTDSRDRLSDRYVCRPPAALPKPPKRLDSFGVGKSSTSNSQSTEDSEPVYDQPHLERSHSDSDIDRASSGSPCDISPYGPGMDEVYSEISPRDTEHLLKCGPVKSRRSMYAEKYRKSFPSASSSFASSSYREDSTDTDSSIRSPKLSHAERLEGEPHYQFRKSNSMKLALKEDEEGGWMVSSPFDRIGKKLTKSSTLPSTARHPGASGQDTGTGWVEGNIYDSSTPLLSQPEYGDQGYYDSGDKRSPPPTMPKPKLPLKPPRPLDPSKFAEVRQVLSRNMTQSNNQYSMVKAPLATPEAIEIGDYAQVRDAVSPHENDYASVHDALPAGKLHRIRSTIKSRDNQGGSDSDSEFSSLERERQKDDIYSRVHRRPTPHKKKYKPRHSDGGPPPPLPPYSEERHLLVQTDQLEKVRSNSPSEGSEGTGDETHNQKKPKKKRSFRSKKKKQPEVDPTQVISPHWSDYDFSSILLSKMSMDDQEGLEPITPRECSSPGRYGEDGEDPDGGYWKRKLKLPSAKEKDPDKLRRKEEKRAKEDEKRKMKEEERKLKEQQKAARKSKKNKDSSKSTPSQSSLGALEDMIQADSNPIPLFVDKCITFIEEEGLTAEGIYRVPGNKAHVDLLIEKFKEDSNVDIRSLDIPVNAVATALKGFFSELAEPLVPSTLQSELLEACNVIDASGRLLAVRTVLKKMPQLNFEVLKYLMKHIHGVSKHSDENSMDTKNLAICWWPTLLRPEFQTFETMALAMHQLEEIVLMMIEQGNFFFPGDSEV